MARVWGRFQLLLLLFLSVSFLNAEAFAADENVREAASLLQLNKSNPRRSAAGKQAGVSHYAKQILSTLFLSGPPPSSGPDSPSPLDPTLAKAVGLLEDAADDGNPDALFLLAEMNFYGNYSHPRNYTEAFRRYNQLAMLNGNSSAQHMVGFLYATGLGGVVPQDQAKAMLYYTFAAEQGNTRAQMVMAYRHHFGIATPVNCEEAKYFYKHVADKAIAWLRSGPPGDHNVVKEAYVIADDRGGVYGEGASISSTGNNARLRGSLNDPNAPFEDVIEYLDLMSRKGDLKATFSLGRLYYDGSRSIRRDFRLSKQYFLEVARQYWPKKGRPRTDVSPGTEKLASKAAGYLGRMFLRGEGVEQNFELAQTWFSRGISSGDATSQYSMGLMYLHGLGVPKDIVKASIYFSAAADLDSSDAQVRLGTLFLDQGDVLTATRYFTLAARNGHIEAFYYLAELMDKGVGRDSTCAGAAQYYKIVAEKAESVSTAIREANEAYESGDIETAIVDYMLAAEQGFESAQANVAYLFDQALARRESRSSLILFSKPLSTLPPNPRLALMYWTRSARQSNFDSYLKMGDYYLAGLGAPVDPEKAAACYHAAADSLASAQAYWNLGWMHENGIGAEQDFHLAKRFYDLALTTSREAYLPVTLALLKLRARSAWNTLTHGQVKGIQAEHVERKKWSFTEWISAFLDADDEYLPLPDDAEDMHHPGLDSMPGADELLDDFEDGVFENVAIVALALALAFLVMYRRRQAEEVRRQREQGQRGEQGPGAGRGDGQQQQQQQEQGMFPPPGDPEWLAWAAGGVGH
ncbi:HCP-like protein [Trichodelitschia bisporula]|uniref:HCP-like protein n=1 Tax=Trichodelitschia bisporula TaxID=703511 RepID=A0A6G1I107_9PEZI|nr:HCP-like protein [Trichodelitschia bisporula]